MNKWGVQRLFEATQIVPRARTTLHITSVFLAMFRKKIWPGPEKSKIVPKTTKIEGYNTRFGLFREPSFERHLMTHRGMGDHWKGVVWLGTNMWMPLRSFRGSFSFTRNEQMGCLKAFRGNINCAKHRRNATSHFGFPRTVLKENMTRPWKFQKCPKNNKNWMLIYVLGLSRSPSFKRHGMPPRDMGGHWKGVMWLETKMWMPLCSFRNNFRLHEKWTNGGV